MFSTENLHLGNRARGPRLLLMTNRKSHTRFRFVPKSTTLDDLEAIVHSISKHMRLSDPTTKISMKINPNYQRQRLSAVTAVSGNIRFMRTFAEFVRDEASNDSGVIENVDFQGFRTLRLRHLRKWGQLYFIVLLVPCRLSTDPKIHDLEWTFYVKFSLLR